MAADGTLARAVSALTRYGGHSRESARRFLGRATIDEARAIAAANTIDQYEEAVEHVLDRLEDNDT